MSVLATRVYLTWHCFLFLCIRFSVSFSFFVITVLQVDFSQFIANIANGFETIKDKVKTHAESQSKGASNSPFVVKVQNFLANAEEKVDELCKEMFGGDSPFCGKFAGWVGNIAEQASKLVGWVSGGFSFKDLIR